MKLYCLLFNGLISIMILACTVQPSSTKEDDGKSGGGSVTGGSTQDSDDDPGDDGSPGSGSSDSLDERYPYSVDDFPSDGNTNHNAQTEYEATDSDSDGIRDIDDNCITESNPDQQDINHNGTGDLCETSGQNEGTSDPATES